ncbi:MAG: hypothetical protein HYX34_13635 [Actinobacteria bacterium]|nr:hypothetical protein [Actinomycetota bacterium]
MAGWPVPVERLALIGHSMGGLVIRAACHAAGEAGHHWPALVGTCVYLGSPHRGAALERAVHTAGALLDRLPEGRASGEILRLRSAGIKDLRHGAVHPDDWADAPPDSWPSPRPRRIPLLAGARHVAVAATLGARRDGLEARILGDLLVPYPSATRPAHRRPEPGDTVVDVVHLPRTDHLSLLNHPQVRAEVVGWLA